MSKRSPSFVRRPSAVIDPQTLADVLANTDPKYPVMMKYNIVDFMYQHVKFESRSNRAELDVFEPLMLELDLWCGDRRISQKLMEQAWSLAFEHVFVDAHKKAKGRKPKSDFIR